MTDVTTIRAYTKDDLEACRELWAELTEWHRRIYDSPGIGGDDPGRAFDEHLARVGAEHVWLAVREDEIVGMVGLIPGDGFVELEPIVITEACRGAGIGRRLAERVIAEARELGARQVVTKPVARNTSTIRFFHALGFDALGQLELVLELRPPEEQVWRPGAELADRPFRV